MNVLLERTRIDLCRHHYPTHPHAAPGRAAGFEITMLTGDQDQQQKVCVNIS